jgi:hypothetical protein
MRSLNTSGIKGPRKGQSAFTAHFRKCTSNAERWAAQSRKTMSPGSGYSADRAGFRKSTGGNVGCTAGGSGVKSTTHKVVR